MKSLAEFIRQQAPQHLEDRNFVPNQYEEHELYWHLVLEYSRKFINEAYSFVQEICNLSPKITKGIQETNESIVSFDNLNASFFKKLEVTIKNNDEMSIVVNGEADIDNSTREEAYLRIELNKDDYDKEELRDTIEHELVHLYQTFHHKKNSKSLRASLNKRFYDNYTNIEDLNNAKDELKLIIYLFDPDECTAKIQGMLAKIDGRKLTNPQRVFEIVSKESYYVKMNYYYKNIDFLEEMIPGLANCYRDIFPKWKSLTREQIIRKLRNYINKNWMIFVKKLSKACVGKCEQRMR